MFRLYLVEVELISRMYCYLIDKRYLQNVFQKIIQEIHSLNNSREIYQMEYLRKCICKLEKKVGRNEKCPCGSGKKFKHCCGSV